MDNSGVCPKYRPVDQQIKLFFKEVMQFYGDNNRCQLHLVNSDSFKGYDT